MEDIYWGDTTNNDVVSVYSDVHLQVPSLSEVTQGKTEQHLEWIYNEIPIFRLLGKTVLVEKEKLVGN